MPDNRFILIAGRTSRQGQHVNIGKDREDYRTITTALTMNAADMKALAIASGAAVLVRTEFGEAVFKCHEGKIPQGMVFVPYGPPTCRMMGGSTDGTGMPTSKGWEVTVEPIVEEEGKGMSI